MARVYVMWNKVRPSIFIESKAGKFKYESSIVLGKPYNLAISGKMNDIAIATIKELAYYLFVNKCNDIEPEDVYDAIATYLTLFEDYRLSVIRDKDLSERNFLKDEKNSAIFVEQ